MRDMKKHKKQKKSTKASTKSKRKKLLGGQYFELDSLDDVEIRVLYYDDKKSKASIKDQFGWADPADVDKSIAKGPSE
jgi:hypothetical protein